MMGRLSTVVLALVTFVASGCTLKNLSGHALKDGELTFGDHDFGARCFDAFGCRIAYNGMYLVKDSGGKRSPPLRCSDLDSLAGHLVGIDNFPRRPMWHGRRSMARSTRRMSMWPPSFVVRWFFIAFREAIWMAASGRNLQPSSSW